MICVGHFYSNPTLSATETKMTYRKDIQILRGLSVLAVLLFHMQVKGLHNGFLGVDIFFVISGFLMAVLYDPKDKKEFFLRRLRRLMPAYLMTILAVLVMAVFLTTPNELPSVRVQAGSALLLAPNIWFWSENSYFSKAAFTPLLHLWSLGVELQFYIILPFLYWLFSKSRLVLPALILSSLILCFAAVEISPKTAFFITPFRLWQFLAGYAVAVYATQNGALKTAQRTQIGLLGLLGLLMIPLIPITPISPNFVTGHPGLPALGITLATSLILAFGLPKLIEDSKLGNGLAALGKYSYSLYLVHFPVIVMMLYKPFEGTILEADSLLQAATILATITALTFWLYHLVENPGRQKKTLLPWLAAPVLLIVVLTATGGFLQNSRFSPQEHLVFGAWYDRSEYRCGKVARLLNPSAISCDLTTALQTPVQTILLVGNSHADSIKTAFTEVAINENSKVYFIVQNMPLMKGGLSPEQIVQEALKRKAKMIVLHYSPGSVSPDAIRKTATLSSEKNIRVAFIAPVPVWETHVPKTLWQNIRASNNLPEQNISQYYEKNSGFLKQIAEPSIAGFKIYEPAPWLCNPKCALISEDGKPLYFDVSHMTLTGGARLKPLFHEIIISALSKSPL